MLEEFNKQFTTKDRKIITSDWREALGALKVYKTLYVNNRVGPLVVGIYLKIASSRDYYIPIYHVHDLCRKFPQLILSLSIKGKMIPIEKHNEMYRQVAEELAEQAFISFDDNLSIDEIIAGYERYFISPNLTSTVEYEDLALICGWTKEAKKIEYVLNLIYNELKTWSEKRYFSEYKGFENWFKNLEKKVWNGDELHSVVESELIEHKLLKVPERKILF